MEEKIKYTAALTAAKIQQIYSANNPILVTLL